MPTDPRIAALARAHDLPLDVVAGIFAQAARMPDATTLTPEDDLTDEVARDPGSASEHYIEEELLGAGGMGEVRRVRDVRLNRTLARKTLHPKLFGRSDATTRFVHEAQTVAQLQHPGIVPVYDLGAGWTSPS